MTVYDQKMESSFKDKNLRATIIDAYMKCSENESLKEAEEWVQDHLYHSFVEGDAFTTTYTDNSSGRDSTLTMNFTFAKSVANILLSQIAGTKASTNLLKGGPMAFSAVFNTCTLSENKPLSSVSEEDMYESMKDALKYILLSLVNNKYNTYALLNSFPKSDNIRTSSHTAHINYKPNYIYQTGSDPIEDYTMVKDVKCGISIPTSTRRTSLTQDCDRIFSLLFMYMTDYEFMFNLLFAFCPEYVCKTGMTPALMFNKLYDDIIHRDLCVDFRTCKPSSVKKPVDGGYVPRPKDSMSDDILMSLNRCHGAIYIQKALVDEFPEPKSDFTVYNIAPNSIVSAMSIKSILCMSENFDVFDSVIIGGPLAITVYVNKLFDHSGSSGVNTITEPTPIEMVKSSSLLISSDESKLNKTITNIGGQNNKTYIKFITAEFVEKAGKEDSSIRFSEECQQKEMALANIFKCAKIPIHRPDFDLDAAVGQPWTNIDRYNKATISTYNAKVFKRMKQSAKSVVAQRDVPYNGDDYDRCDDDVYAQVKTKTNFIAEFTPAQFCSISLMNIHSSYFNY